MKVIKSVAQAAVTVVDDTAKVIHATLPVIGEAIFHTTSMVNDSVKTARLESLIENQAEVQRIKKESGIEDFSDIDALMIY